MGLVAMYFMQDITKCIYNCEDIFIIRSLQPIAVRYQTQTSSISRRNFRFSVVFIQPPPAIIRKSSVQRAGGRPTWRLPTRSLHSRTRLLRQPTVLQPRYPAHCLFKLVILQAISATQLNKRLFSRRQFHFLSYLWKRPQAQP